MENEIVKRENPQSFIERLIEHAEDLEKVKEVGMVIINSGFCPEHFKQSRDAVGAIMCIEAGRKLGLTWMQSLSDIYPVKGRIGIMGSAARAVIFSSGILDKWEEITEGTYPEDNYKHIIISKRKGLPGEFRSEFSVYDAKKAGLFQKDIYQRYGKRLIMWRNIGFHATDYYGDVMKGMKTVEELNDFDVIPGVGDTTLEKEDGTKINITAGAKGKSSKMTSRVTDKIPENRFGDVNIEHVTDAEVVSDENKGEDTKTTDNEPIVPQRGSEGYMDGKLVMKDGKKVEDEQGAKDDGKWSLKDMESMDTKALLDIVMNDTDMMEASEMIEGKNTNKKLREIIYAHQHGTLQEHVAKNKPEDAGTEEPPEQAPVQGEIPVNKDFDNQGGIQGAPAETPPVEEKTYGNKYDIIVPDFDKGNERDFATVKSLFNKLMGVEPQITTPRYMDIAVKLGFDQKYKDKETFCKYATVEEINLLLNNN